ncbi:MULTISPECIES: TonB-dependent receptor [unclassified Microbulbifer]|uniref:TonB-dependent receptor n=1 Tax=unclassified Microbulbifer TaxID=2619833 RepID=UPI0027E3BCA1|nr:MULTISPECIES: TonB-dependent receptor [unclassified Microbulbifer]
MKSDMKSGSAKAALVWILASAGACAQAQDTEEIQVTGSRLDTPVMSPARQVTTIAREDIQLQLNAGGSLAEIIAREVPGMGQPSQSFTNYAQSLRGRDILVLIDGVPMNTNRGVSRDLFNIHAENVEKVEVVRGGNAIYGSGATGGVIFITTRQAAAGHEKETGFSLSAPTDYDADGANYRFRQGFFGTAESFDYALNLVSERRGANFDAEGDRIAPEPSQGDMFDADIWSLNAKLGRNFGSDQRLQLTGLYHDADQDTDYASDPSVTAEPLHSVRAQAIKGLQMENQNTAENTVVSLDYFNRNIAGSALHAQIFHRDYLTRFYPFDARTRSNNRHLAQTELEATVYGGRLTLTTPFSDGTELMWGMDLQRDESAMPVLTYDGDAYDQSGGLVFDYTGRKTYMPPITHDSAAAFAQLHHRFDERWAFDGGLRHEQVEMSFDDFVTLPQTLEPDPAVTRGGTVDYDASLFNASLVFTPGGNSEWYLAFNQGFELPDVGLQVRNANSDFDIHSSQLEAIETDNIEIGWRGNWDAVQASLALYRSTSDLGRVQTENFGLTLSRSEEKISGVEATLDFQVDDQWSGGVTVSRAKGEEKSSGADGFQDMNGFRIPPLKMTAYSQYRSAGQLHRLQLLYSASEDFRLDGVAGFGRRTVDSYTTLDWLSRWNLNTGSIELGLENLLNEDYFTVYGQLLRSSTNTSHIPARGRTLRLGYRVDW